MKMSDEFLSPEALFKTGCLVSRGSLLMKRIPSITDENSTLKVESEIWRGMWVSRNESFGSLGSEL
jgi:hypothetical protein